MSMADHSSSWAGKRKIDLGRVKVKLTCGHFVWMRLHPLRSTTKFSCRAGMGCGYTLNWLDYEDTESGRRGQNEAVLEKIKAEAEAQARQERGNSE